MLVVFGAFKSEVYGLLKLMSHKKTVKGFKSKIYAGKIHSQEIMIVITGKGKFNAKMGVDDVILLNPPDPVFLIQGISGSLIENLDIGDLVIYETVKNLEKISDIPNDFESLETKSEDVPGYLKLDNSLDYCNCDEIKLTSKTNNFDFNIQVSTGGSSIIISDVFKISGATVPYILTNHDDKIKLSKTYDVAAVDMESFYIADAAVKKGIPVICIRAISDNIGESIPVFFAESDRSSVFKKILFISDVLRSGSKTRLILRTLKNVKYANKNLNGFITKTVLPLLGYKQA